MSGVALPTMEDHQQVLDELAALRATLSEVVDLVGRAITPPQLLDTDQAVAYTTLSAKTLRKLRAAGELAWHEIEGLHRYRRDDLDALIARRTTPATDPPTLRAVAT